MSHTPKPSSSGTSKPPRGGVTSHPVTPPHAPTKGGKDPKAEAARLRAEGLTVSEIGRRLGVARETVSRWVNHAAAEAVEAERAKRAQTFEDAVAASRQRLRDGLADAAAQLVDLTKHPDPAVRLRAVCALMDRGGLPRVEVVQSAEAPLDLSALSAEELDAFEALLAKAKGGA